MRMRVLSSQYVVAVSLPFLKEYSTVSAAVLEFSSFQIQVPLLEHCLLRVHLKKEEKSENSVLLLFEKCIMALIVSCLTLYVF